MNSLRTASATGVGMIEGDDFRIGEGGSSAGRAATVGDAGVGFKEVINEAEDVSYLVYNGRQVGCPPEVKRYFMT